jgi:hypothetical protein
MNCSRWTYIRSIAKSLKESEVELRETDPENAALPKEQK